MVDEYGAGDVGFKRNGKARRQWQIWLNQVLEISEVGVMLVGKGLERWHLPTLLYLCHNVFFLLMLVVTQGNIW